MCVYIYIQRPTMIVGFIKSHSPLSLFYFSKHVLLKFEVRAKTTTYKWTTTLSTVSNYFLWVPLYFLVYNNSFPYSTCHIRGTPSIQAHDGTILHCFNMSRDHSLSQWDCNCSLLLMVKSQSLMVHHLVLQIQPPLNPCYHNSMKIIWYNCITNNKPHGDITIVVSKRVEQHLISYQLDDFLF